MATNCVIPWLDHGIHKTIKKDWIPWSSHGMTQLVRELTI